MKIAITGEIGFIGYHLTQYFKYQTDHEVISLTRDYINNIDKLVDCDWLIHCAGVNRGSNVLKNNIDITTSLVKELISNNIKVNVSFISSIQEDLDNDYSKSKKECHLILEKYCIDSNTKYIKHKLLNIFGPFVKPNYNSVVATFCYNLVNNIDCTVNNSDIKLCYIYDAIQVIASFKEFDHYNTVNITINDLYMQLLEYHIQYSKGIIPKLNTKFHINLFNTYRSYSKNIHILDRHIDNRGYLIELVKCNGSESQVFLSTTKPDITRGNHFHFNKIERFCIVSGTANIGLRKIGSEEIFSYIIDDMMNTIIDIPIMHTHNITNIGSSDLICIFWVNEIFNSNQPDTYLEKV